VFILYIVKINGTFYVIFRRIKSVLDENCAFYSNCSEKSVVFGCLGSKFIMQVTDVKRIFRVEHGTGRNSDDYERRYSNMERNNIVEFYTAHGT